MNLPRPLYRSAILSTAIAAFAFTPMALAENFVLNANDNLNQSSFNSGLHWPGGAEPIAGNNYQTGAFRLRTPQAIGDFVFAGDSLEIQAGLGFRLKTAGTITVNNLIVADGGIVELTQPNGSNVPGAAGTLAGNITLNGTAILHAGINTDVFGEELTISSVIAGSGGFQTTGSNGHIVLTGNNSFTGNVTLNGLANSTLRLGSANAVPNSTMTINLTNSLAFSPGIGAFSIGGLAGTADNVLDDTSGAAITAMVGGNNASTTYSGGLSGLGGVTKVGSGTLTLSGTNFYNGPTIVNAGKLNITGSLSSPSGGAVTINAGATLNVAGSLGLNNAVTIAAGGILNGTGLIEGTIGLTSGSTAVARGTINLTDNVFGTLTMSNTAGLTLGGLAGDSVQLVFEAGATNSDLLSLGANSLNLNSGGALITVADAGYVANRTYTLMSFGNGTGAGFATGTGATVGALTLTNPNLSFGITGSLLVSATQVQLVTSGASAPATAYWSGIRGTQWTDINGNDGNFTTDAQGTDFIHAYPAATTDVIFANASTTNLTTTLGQNFSIKSLTFGGSTAAATIGGNNTLTVGAGGVALASGNGGATLAMNNLALGAAQTWSNASNQPMVVSAVVTGTEALTINSPGSGLIVLSGANTYSGGTTINSGVLRLSGNGTLGAPTNNLTMNAGLLELNGTSQSIGTLSGAGGQIVNNGSVNSTLTIGNGDALSSDFAGVLADTTNGSTGLLEIRKTGIGTLVLSGLNTYSGATTLSGGVLSVGVLANGGLASGIGKSSSAVANLVFDGGTLQYTGPANTIDRDFTINAGKAAVLEITANKLTLTGASAASTGGLTKAAAGELSLAGTNAYTGLTSVRQGTLSVTGVLNTAAALGTGSFVVAANAGDDATLRISGGTVNIGGNGPVAGISGSIGPVAASSGSLVLSGGAIVSNSGAVKQNINTGMAGYGAFTMTAGTVSLAGNFGVGTANGGLGIQNFSGGSVTITEGYASILGNGLGGLGIANYTGTSSLNATSAAAAPTAFVGMVVGENGAGILNVSGNASLLLGGSPDAAGLDIARANTASGIVNLGAVGSGGGTITTNIVRHSGAGATGVLNFHGGKLQAASFANPDFMNGLSGAYVFAEGGTIDTNGTTITINQSLEAPVGQGLTGIALTANGIGYLNTPLVTITGGTLAANGTEATAVAQFDAATGQVTGITITNPGSYLDTSTIGVTIAGGGSFASAPIIGAISSAANSSGGISKTGAGSLTLSGMNTFSGVTTVSEGDLVVTGSLTGGVAVMNGSTLAGDGTIGSVSVAAGGMVSPGQIPGSIATLNLSDLLVSGNAQLQLELNTTTTTTDLLNVSGNLSLDLGGSTMLALSDVGADVALAAGSVFTLIQYNGAWNGGTFAGRPNHSEFALGANVYSIVYDDISGLGKAVTLTVVPEPATASVVLASLGVLLGLNRRRSRQL